LIIVFGFPNLVISFLQQALHRSTALHFLDTNQISGIPMLSRATGTRDRFNVAQNIARKTSPDAVLRKGPRETALAARGLGATISEIQEVERNETVRLIYMCIIGAPRSRFRFVGLSNSRDVETNAAELANGRVLVYIIHGAAWYRLNV